MPNRAQDVKAIFDEAAEIEAPADRAAFLDRACAGDPELRREVEELLQAYAHAGSFLDRPALGPSERGERGSGSVAGATIALDGAGAEPDPPRGSRIHYLGDYELLAVLGTGGMGVVYRARQLSLQRLVAVKMLRSGAWAGDEEVRRFRNEAEAVAELDHPGIVPIHEVGEHHGRLYFSMKLVEGQSLAQRLADYAADPRAAARLVAHVARAVHHAHMRGILHRDLKPANILLDAESQPHVTDFGLARRIDADVGMTESGAVVGTPGYMAPEQAEGRRRAITTATDVYGLGALLYACLTGRAPFEGDSVINVLDQVRQQPPPRPGALNSRVDRDLETICLKCLEKDPRRRYASADAVAADLDRYVNGEPILARRTSLPERVVKWARRRPAIAALVLLLNLVAVTGLAGILWQWRRAEKILAVADKEGRRADDKAREAAQRAREAGERAENLRRQDYVSRVNIALREVQEDNILLAEDLLFGCPAKMRGWEWDYVMRLSHAQ